MIASLYDQIKIITREVGSSFFYPTLALSRRDSASLGDSAGSSRRSFKSGPSRFRGRCASPTRLKEAASHFPRSYFALDCMEQSRRDYPWSKMTVVEECFEDLEIRERVDVGSIASSVGALFSSDQPLEYCPYSLLEMFEREKRVSTGGACT